MKFSVGKIKYGSDTLAKCTGITIRVDGNPVDLYAGGFSDPLEIEIGNRAITISVEFAEWSGDVAEVQEVLDNLYVDIEVQASDYSVTRGLTSTTKIERCKAVSWEAASTQDGWVTYRMEFRKAYQS